MEIRRDSLITIVGARGSGKTVIARKLISEMGKGRAILIVDPWNEYGDMVPGYSLSAEGFAQKFFETQESNRLVTYDPEEIEAVLRFIWSTQGTLVVVDEADLILTARNDIESFRRLLAYGRHFGIGMIIIARRAADLPRSFTAQSSIFFSRVVEPRDKTYFKNRIGREVPELSEYEWEFSGRDGSLESIPPSWAEEFVPKGEPVDA